MAWASGACFCRSRSRPLASIPVGRPRARGANLLEVATRISRPRRASAAAIVLIGLTAGGAVAGGPGDPRAEATRRASEPAEIDPAPRPIVWIQAGHTLPREPGYRDQTGAGSGPFGSEIGFTARLAPKVIARLRGAGVDARLTPGRVTPRAARGAAFISLHHDTPQGAGAIGHAITGAGENYYRGEGGGDPRPTPYPDSAPHRPATTVSALVERRSRVLAARIDARYRAVYTAANGARATYRGVQTRGGNPRMMRYYGFYRTRAAARVIVEAGAGSTDDVFLARTSLIAGAISAAIVMDLRARALLPRAAK